MSRLRRLRHFADPFLFQGQVVAVAEHADLAHLVLGLEFGDLLLLVVLTGAFLGFARLVVLERHAQDAIAHVYLTNDVTAMTTSSSVNAPSTAAVMKISSSFFMASMFLVC